MKNLKQFLPQQSLKLVIFTLFMLLGAQLLQTSSAHQELHDHLQEQSDCLLCHQLNGDDPTAHHPIHALVATQFSLQLRESDSVILTRPVTPYQGRAPPLFIL